MPAHIMVFDDDHSMQDMFVDLLEDAGYTVTIQRAPSVTVAEVEQTAPDLIIVDWMSGREKRGMRLIERLAAYQPTAGIPIVACSIEIPPRTDQADAATHDIGIVRKPFALNHLMTVIAQQLATDVCHGIVHSSN